MNNENKDFEKEKNDNKKVLDEALNNIFGEDYIDLDNNLKYLDDKPLFEENEVFQNLKETNENFKNVFDDSLFSVRKEETTYHINPVSDQKSETFKDIKEPKKEQNLSKKVRKDKQYVEINPKKIIPYVIGILVIILILLYLLISNFITKKRVVSCSFVAEDTGYKIVDEYKITYSQNKIKYIESVYNYTVKTDEFKSQIEYIKNEKLPVIINSNGMPGFTYIYETNDNFFELSGYLDFELMEFDKIDKIDKKVNPITYFDINSKITYKDLQKELSSKGYVCTASK